MPSARSLSSLLRNLARPGYARVIAGKVRARFGEDDAARQRALAWYRDIRVRPVDYFAAIDPELAAETAEFGAKVRERAAVVSAEVGFDVDSAGRYELLYFLTRRQRPKVVVETGVAYGYSSYAFLAALARNGDGGRLWSSDFPFFRRADPERFVGIMVPDDLRSGWSLRTKGDGVNLPEMLAEFATIDLFHYDSDKSARGRSFGCGLVLPRLAESGVFLMDDIQDNAWFHDYVMANGPDDPRSKSVVVFGGSNRAFVGGVGVEPLPHPIGTA